MGKEVRKGRTIEKKEEESEENLKWKTTQKNNGRQVKRMNGNKEVKRGGKNRMND